MSARVPRCLAGISLGRLACLSNCWSLQVTHRHAGALGIIARQNADFASCVEKPEAACRVRDVEKDCHCIQNYSSPLLIPCFIFRPAAGPGAALHGCPQTTMISAVLSRLLENGLVEKLWRRSGRCFVLVETHEVCYDGNGTDWYC